MRARIKRIALKCRAQLARSSGRLELLLLAVASLFSPAELYAACSATVSIEVAPPTLAPGTDYAVVTIVHAFAGSSTGSVALEGFQGRSVGASGTNVFYYPMGCKTSGTYPFRAIATPTGPGCDTTADRATAETAITVDSQPEIEASAIGLTGPGQYTLRIAANWAFPLTGTSSSNRHIKFFVSGFGVDPPVSTLEPKQGSGEFNVTVACLATGTQVLTAVATSCDSSHPDHVATSSPTNFQITASKIRSVSLSPNPIGFTATVGYAFQATTGAFRRRVTSTFNGSIGPSDPGNLVNAMGTTDLKRNGCLSPGNYPMTIYAIACPGVAGESGRTDRRDITVSIPMLATSGAIDLVARYEPSSHSVYFSGNQALPSGFTSAQRVIRRLASADEEGNPIPAVTLHTATVGTGPFTELGPFPLPNGPRNFEFEATLQFCNGYLRDGATVTCDPCNRATANPVYLDDGNMRYTDTDPLPRLLGRVALDRTYDSHHRFRGSLGRGWWTMFDRRLTVTPSTPGEIITLTTHTNESVGFSHVHGEYLQLFPKGRNGTGTLTLDTATGLFRYLPEQATTEHLFRASDGRFVGLRDLVTGQQMTIAYGAGGLPLSVTDSWTDLTWTITTDSAKRRITTITAGGLMWTYQYDANDNLVTVLAPGNAAWRKYEHVNDRMTVARDAVGNLIESHDYDATGRAINSTGPQDEIQSIDFNIAGSTSGERITRVTAKSGAVADYAMRPIGGAWRTVRVTGGCTSCGQRDTTYVYGSEGHVTREQDASGFITATTYANNRLVSEARSLRPSDCDPETNATRCRLDPDGLASTTLVATASSLTTSYEYGDPRWPDRPTRITTPSVIAAAPRGREETVQYHPISGAEVSRTLSGWTSGEEEPQRLERKSTTTYYGDAPPPPRDDEDPREPVDPFAPAFAPGGSFAPQFLALPQPGGLPKATDGPRTDVNDVTLFVYYPVDEDVPAGLRGRLAAIRNAAGHVTRFEDYDQFGNVTRVVDPNGVATESTYDSLGRLKTSTLKGVSGCDTTADPLCNTDLTSIRTYAPSAGPLDSEQRPAGGATKYTYDGRGRVQTISRGPSANDLREQIDYTYDPISGKKSSERNLAFENGEWVEKRQQSFLYDIHGQLEHVVHADETRVTYAYDGDGKLASVRDERHATPNTFYDYDPADRIRNVSQTIASTPGGTIVTGYAYDPHGNLTAVTDPNGNVTAYGYDDLGRMLQQASPVTGISTYSYDEADNLLSTTDANGSTTTRTYDVLGRVTRAVSVRNGSGEEVTWTYDTAPFGVGRLRSMTDPTGSTTYAYERRGFLMSETKQIDAASYVTSFKHDGNGNRSSIGYPSGRVVAYQFDFADRPQSATTAGMTLVASAHYLPFGPADQIVYGNGTTKQMSYDNRYRPELNELTTGERTLASYRYVHDAAGNITSISDLLDSSFNRAFDYDDLNRLTIANTSWALWGSGTYVYDAMGNMRSIALGERTTNFAYQGTTPKLTEVLDGERARSVAYDAAGNEQSVGSASYAYSPRNQLRGAGNSSYIYDGRGIRTITVRAMTIASLTITPSTVTGGNSATGEVRLSGAAPAGGAVIALTCSNAAATVPASVVIAAGSSSSTFTITTQSVAEQQNAIVTATYNGSTATANLQVAGPRFDEITTQGSVVGGTTTSGMVTLTGTAPEEGVPVSLESSNAAAAVPAEIVIPGGSDRAAFPIVTRAVSVPTRANISAFSRLGENETSLTIRPPSIATLSINPNVLFGGSTATGTLTLEGPAPAGGLVASLQSSSDAITLPGTVAVTEGTTTASFMLTVTPVESVTRLRVSATISGSEEGVDVLVTIQPPVLAELTVTPASVVGGEPAAALTTINAPAASQGARVELTTSDPSIVVAPTHVVIVSGATSATTSLDTLPVATPTPVVVSATRHGVTRSATLTVTPPPVTLATITINPSSLIGTNTATGIVTMTDPAPVALEIEITSSDPTLADVSPIVAIPAGAREAVFSITTALVTTTTSVVITASHGVTTKSSTLTLLPPAGNYVAAFSVSPAFIVQGTTATGSVTLALPVADSAVEVTLTSGDPSVISLPPSVTVKRKETSVTFAVGEASVTTPKAVELTASYGGVVRRTRVVVAPENAVVISSLTVAPDRVAGGNPVAAIITLTSPAPFGGAEVSLAGRPRKMLTMPASITVPEGATSVTFAIGTALVHGQKARDVEIEATYSGVSVTAALSVSPTATTEARMPVAQCASMSIVPCLAVSAIAPDATLTERVFSFYTPELNLLAESVASSAAAPPIAYEYVWFGGQPLAQIAATGAIAWYFNDHLGTPVVQTDDSARVIWQVDYDPYGNAWLYRAGEARHQPLRLPGQENDGVSELAYNVFRHYRQAWGRYTTADPLGKDGDAHPYLYAAANPITTIDRYGLLAEVVCARIGAFGLSWTPFRHCRIRVTCDRCEGGRWGGPYDTSIGLERNRQSPRRELHVTNEAVGGAYTYRYPINNVDQQDSCQFGRCVQAVAQTYRDDADPWTAQYREWGPNSNSFAGHVMRFCGGVGPPDGPFGATGFNQPLGFE